MILLYFKQKYKGFLPLCMKDNIIKNLSSLSELRSLHDANENRTRVTTVKGWCLNRLTMAPYYVILIGYDRRPN